MVLVASLPLAIWTGFRGSDQRGKLHGPYWYLYMYAGDGKYKKLYIGKTLK